MGIQKNLNVGGNLNVGNNTLFVNSQGSTDTIRIGINTNTPRCSLDINTNDALLIPSGNDSQFTSVIQKLVCLDIIMK